MAGSFRDLTVYKKAYALAIEIFEITKKFPSEEKHELTDQTRRSSRAVRKEYRELRNKSEEVGRMINHMMKNPEKYRPKQ